jgi:hypothetical protein
VKTERSRTEEAGAIGLVVRMEMGSRGEDGGINGGGGLWFGERWEQVYARPCNKNDV